MAMAKKPVILCILDGWGWREDSADNAIALARTPNWDRLLQSAPQSLLTTCGLDVGLPQGQMGNSEVGHMNLGAGRVVMQDLPRIDAAIQDGCLKNSLLQILKGTRVWGNRVIEKNSDTPTTPYPTTLHLMGLYSPGGVHSHQNHILALAKILNDAEIPTLLHLWLDGRDTPPKSAGDYLKELEQKLKSLPHVKAATICGRYYAMDRDNRWDRVKLAYDAMIDGVGAKAQSLDRAIGMAYAAGETDEFVKPIILPDFRPMQDGDAILCANFRSDRVRQILAAFLDENFKEFAARRVKFSSAIAMTEYSEDLAKKMQILFAPQSMGDILGEIIARENLTQLRIAETEKYPHVTFFFNGGKETPYAGEDRILVPSPKVATYDLQPEMSAFELTEKLTAAINSKKYDFILVNYANPDMVGHTGKLDAAIKAVEAVDQCLGRIMDATEKAGGVMLITADHGNCEIMRDPETGEPHTAHTLNPVKLFLFPGDIPLMGGRLADVAPTILRLLSLPQPQAMTGKPLLAGTNV